eukprot:2116591-Prymnesium_polylepis.1
MQCDLIAYAHFALPRPKLMLRLTALAAAPAVARKGERARGERGVDGQNSGTHAQFSLLTTLT